MIDGLGGKIGSSFDKNEIRQILANLQKRTFFLKSAHLDDIRLFSTRWVMSYLKGPLKKAEISTLMKAQKEAQNIQEESIETRVNKSEALESFQHLDDSIPQYYEPDILQKNIFSPTLCAKTSIHFYNQSKGIDEQKTLSLCIDIDGQEQSLSWINAREEEKDFTTFPHSAPQGGKFHTLPKIILEDKGLKKAIRELKETLYQEQHLELFRCASPKLESKVEESHRDFIVRIQDILQEKKEVEIEKLQTRYGSKEKTLLNRLERAKERMEKESSDSTGSMIEAGIAVLGALFGRTSPTKIGRAVSKGSKILKERGEMGRAEERVLAVQEDIEALEYELEDKIDDLTEKFDIENCEIESFKIKPRKTDIDVEICAVVWRA